MVVFIALIVKFQMLGVAVLLDTTLIRLLTLAMYQMTLKIMNMVEGSLYKYFQNQHVN